MATSAWKKSIEKQAEKCSSFTGVVCVNVSGGHGSLVAWSRCLQWYGKDRVIPVFADTNSEHPDLYRFLDDCEDVLGQKLERLNDGRNIWDVFNQTGISRIAHGGGACKASVELKQKPLDKHFRECGADAIAVGLEFTEIERMQRFEKKLSPSTVLFPLSAAPRLGECDIHEEVRRLGIKPCVVYDEGQPHNNCRKYGCILAGTSQWASDVTHNTDGFNYSAAREQEFFEKTGFTILRDRRNGVTKSYQLAELKEDVHSGRKFSRNWKSQCSCMEPQQKLFTEEECFSA